MVASYNAMHQSFLVGSASEKQTNQFYYVASSRRKLSPKRTWNQRFRITKAEKPVVPPITDTSSEFSLGSNILSHSMKYTEPWLYGTVRGIPARPVHGQSIFTPIPTEVAVVVCSCPEYLSGTKREIKKASICKKCKGSRLPLAPIGGTVRISSTAVPVVHKSRASAGTMRILPTTSSAKVRPSILDPQNDPYDLMRRTRLLSPEPKSLSKSSDKNIRNIRAKSTSPTRGRNKNKLKSIPLIHSSVSSKQDRWSDVFESDSSGRRSILHCDVNPYDLLSNASTHMNEFSPSNDDDNIFSSNNRHTGTISKSTGKTVNYSNVKAIAGQRISLGMPASSSLITQIDKNLKYDGTSTEKNISEKKDDTKGKSKHVKSQQLQQKKQQLYAQQNQHYHTTNEMKFVKKDGLTDIKQQPKRPPRRKHDTNTTADEKNKVCLSTITASTNTKMTNELNGTTEKPCVITSVSLLPSTSSFLTKQEISTDSGSNQKHQGGIKSILKRPSSLTSSSSSSSTTISISPAIEKDAKKCPDDTIVHNSSFTISNNDKTLSKSTNIKGEIKCNDKINGSQFYLPLPTQPTRKKVQFMVEDKIILDQFSKENKILEENENNQTKVATVMPTITTFTTATVEREIPSKIIMKHNGQDRITSSKQYQDKQQEISNLLQQKKKKSDIEVIVGSSNNNSNGMSNKIEEMNKNKEDSDCIVVANNILCNLEGTQIENSSKLIVNGKPVLSSSSSSSLPLSDGISKYCSMNSKENNENNVFVVKSEENINEKKQFLSLQENNENDELAVQSSISKKSSLRRTLSDRRLNNTTTIILNFNDTMALRTKNTHVNLKDLFLEDEQSNQQQLTQQNDEKDLENNKIEKYERKQQQQQQQQSILKPKSNDFPVEITESSKTLMSHIKIINDEIISDNVILNKESLRKPRNEIHQTLISSQQHQKENYHQMVEKPQLEKCFRQQEQQQQSKEISCQENGILMIKNNPNTSSGWLKENNIKNMKNIHEDSNIKPSDLNSITDKVYSSTSISEITDVNIDINRGVCTSNSDYISRNSSIKDQQQNNQQQNFNLYPPQEHNVDKQNKVENIKDYENKYTKYFHEKRKEKEKEKFIQAQNEIHNGARLFAGTNQNTVNYNNRFSNNSSQKAIVRVAPFNKTSSEIHRLKIQHQDDINTMNQKKTSILINGDDCYSTVNVNNDIPVYQSSVVVTDGSKNNLEDNISSTFLSTHINAVSTTTATTAETNTVTISVSSCDNNIRTQDEEIIYNNNKINTLLSQNVTKSVIPIIVNNDNIENNNVIRNDKNGNNNDNSSKNNINNTNNDSNPTKRIRTLITLDYDSNCDDGKKYEGENNLKKYCDNKCNNDVFPHEEELVKLLRNPVEAVKRNLVPHVCGKLEDIAKSSSNTNPSEISGTMSLKQDKNSFIGKLLQDSTLKQLAYGLDSDVITKLIENSLKRLKDSRNYLGIDSSKDNDDMAKLIDICLQKIKEEKHKIEETSPDAVSNCKKSYETLEDQENQSNRGSISSGNSYGSANYELFDFENNESDFYQSCSSEITADDDSITNSINRNKFYQILVDATLSEIEISTTNEDDHHYESIRINSDPIYEEINDIPPPLPLSPPPINDSELDKKNSRSMFEGASKYDILSYLVDAKERGIVREEAYEYNFSNTSDIIVEEESDTLSDLNKKQINEISSRMSHLSITSDSSEDTSLINSFNEKTHQSSLLPTSSSSTIMDRENLENRHQQQRKSTSSDIERNDSGVGSETSKSSRSKYQNSSFSSSTSSSSSVIANGGCVLNKNSPIHLCEDCDGPVETQITDSGVMYAPLVCRKCGKKRAERKEIITEIVETEEKYGRDLQIIIEEFCKPMLVAGLLTQEQLSAIFLNTEELLENNQALAERMRDALDIALEQGDDDLLTVNIGKIFLESTTMLHAFESYCIRQAGASLLLANLEKEKELLRIFLRVSQMENAVLRRMNLNSFLMVPVQRVTKYPLLLSRLYKVTPTHLEGRELLKQAQEKIELHLNHMNREAKDVPSKLWRRISSSSPNRKASCEIDMINIKLRKMSIDILEWNHDEVRFAMEGKLLFTQPTDSNWKKVRTIKLTPVNALLVTNGKPSSNYKAEKAVLSDQLNFPKHTGIREAALLLVKEKCGRYTLIREPLYLDRCVIYTESDWDDYFEVNEITSKDTFIFKAEDGVRSQQWYAKLQYHAQGMGVWRKRRNALANIMINGMLSRT